MPACVALGLSAFIMQSTESIISMCFNSSLLKYGGDVAVGAMTIQCHAVCHAAIAGCRTGCPADHQLQFRCQEQCPCQKEFPTPADHQPDLLCHPLDLRAGISADFCRYVYKRCQPFSLLR